MQRGFRILNIGRHRCKISRELTLYTIVIKKFAVQKMWMISDMIVMNK